MSSSLVILISTSRSHGLAFVMLTCSLIALVALLYSSTGAEAGYTPHDPIYINGNSQLNATNGVVSGIGTQANPYVISGWRIDATSATAIEIWHTDKFLTITNVTIVGEVGEYNYSVTVSYSDNIRFEHVEDRSMNATARFGVCDDLVVFDFKQTNDVARRASFSSCDGSSLRGIDVTGELVLARSKRSIVRDCVAASYRMYEFSGSWFSNCTDGGSDEPFGLTIDSTKDTQIVECTFTNNTQADVYIKSGGNVSMRDCQLGVRGVQLNPDGYHRLGHSNTVNGSKLRYYLNQTGVHLDTDAGQVIIVGCNNVSVTNLTLSGADVPINLFDSENVSMDGLQLAGHRECLNILESRNVTVSNMTAYATVTWPYSPATAIRVVNTPEMRFVDCHVKEEFNYGIHYSCDAGLSERVDGLRLDNVTIDAYYYGVYFECLSWWDLTVDRCEFTWGGNGAVYTQNHGRVRVNASTFRGCDRGVFLFMKHYRWDDPNEVTNCTFHGGFLPIEMGDTVNIVVADNLFINASYRAIMLIRVSDVLVRNNTIDEVSAGSPSFYPTGIELEGDYLTVEMNTIRDCEIALLIDEVRYSTVRLNLFQGCDWGLWARRDCRGTEVFHNNFVMNNYDYGWSRYADKQALTSSANIQMYNGTEGNYWADYLQWYPDAQPLNARVWDTPYSLYYREHVNDSYPLRLMADWHPPVAVAGTDMTVPQGTLVSLDGSASSDDTGISRYEWELVHPAWNRNATGAWFNTTLDDPGTVTATLRVWDPWGNVGVDTITIRVRDTIVPVAEAGEDVEVDEDTEVTFDGSTSTDNVGVVNWTWTFTDGVPVTLVGVRPSHTFVTPGVFVVTLLVGDADGNWATDTVTVTVVDATPPVANAGPDQIVDEDTEVTFDGSGSLDNVGIVNWTWSFPYITSLPEDPPVALHGETARFTFERPGVYEVTLTVRDAVGHSHVDHMTVTVNDITPPVPVFDLPSEVPLGTTVTLDGGQSRDNKELAGFDWAVEGPGGTDLAEGMTASYTFEVSGDHLVTLNVTDAAGNWAIVSHVVAVVDDVNPVADAGDDIRSFVGEPVTFDGSASSDNVDIVGWKWSFEYDGARQTLEGESAAFTFMVPDVYSITLEVVDGSGLRATDTVLVTVWDVTPPLADAGADVEVAQGTEVTFDGSGCWDDVGVNYWMWAFNVDGYLVILEGEVAKHTFDAPGTYAVNMTVEDASGNLAHDEMVVTVLDTEPPVAVARGDAEIEEGTSLTLDASNSTDNVGITSYEWMVEGPGGTDTLRGSTVSHLFTNPGTHTVTLVVTDDSGNSDEASFTVEVTSVEVPDDGNGDEESDGYLMYVIVAIIVVVIAVALIVLLKRRQ